MSKSISMRIVSKNVVKFAARIPGSEKRVNAPEGVAIAQYSNVKEGGQSQGWVRNSTDTQKGATPDGTWQSLDEGNYLVANQVSFEAGRKACELTPEGYSFDDLMKAVGHLVSAGFTDQYASDNGTANGNPKKDRAPRWNPLEVLYGTADAFKADPPRKEIIRGLVAGSDAVENILTRKGGVLYIDQLDGLEVKRIEEAILLETFMLKGGQEINLDDLVEA